MSLIARSVRLERRAMPTIPPPPRPSERDPDIPYLSTSDHDALEVAAVVACVGLRAGALSQMPIKAYTDSSGVPMLVDPQPELLSSPSDSVVPSTWKTQMSIARDLWGNAVGQILAVDGAGYPARVEWFPPQVVTAMPSFGRPVEWRIAGNPVDSSLILHVPSRWVLPGTPLGISPLEHSGLVDLARRCQRFGADWFARGAIPSAILYSDKELTAEQADGLLTRMKSRWRRREPAVLGSGLRYEPVSVKANESQFLETAMRVAADIAISFNLPPSRVAAAVTGSTLEYTNRDQSQQQYLVDSINPDLVVIQDVLARHMPPGVYPRWQTGALLRSDLKTRYEAAAIGIGAQFLHPNEVRALEELPPLTAEQLATMPKGTPMPAAPAPKEGAK